MSDIVLFHAPSACSRVTMNALEEIGLDFEDRAVNIFIGEQKESGYLAINPKGKVPTLKIGEKIYTENAAIIYMLATQHPDASLIPLITNHAEQNIGLEDLVWCSSFFHPMVRQIRMPSRFTDGPTDGIKAHGLQHLPAILSQIERRVSKGRWWYGDRWSILDVYIYWNYSTAEIGGADLSPWPGILDHSHRVRARPSFVRTLAREHASLVRHGISLPAGVTL
jgi:glutathione S-transferase